MKQDAVSCSRGRLSYHGKQRLQDNAEPMDLPEFSFAHTEPSGAAAEGRLDCDEPLPFLCN